MAPSAIGDRLLIVISGPGGVGKGTLVQNLMARDGRLWLSRSWSSRQCRPGEAVDAYNFVSRSEFDDHIAGGGFLEWVDFLDYRQGTPVPNPPDGLDVVFEIDVFGGEAIVEKYHDALLVFLDTPSLEVQRQRLEGRGDRPAKVAARIERGDLERAKASEVGYVTVINDDLDRATSELAALIATARSGE